MLIQPDSVRHEFPLGTSYFRGVLRLAAGFPDLRLLCPIRHPSALALVSLPDRYLVQESTRAHAVSGLFTLPCPNAVNFIFSPRSGAFGASWVPRRISSCMPRPDDSAGSPQPSPLRLLLCCLRCALKPSASGTDLVEAVPALQGTRFPLRPTGFSVYAYLTSLFAITDSAVRSRLDTGGWLTLTRQGLSPCKMRRASPSAITPCSAGPNAQWRLRNNAVGMRN